MSDPPEDTAPGNDTVTDPPPMNPPLNLSEADVQRITGAVVTFLKASPNPLVDGSSLQDTPPASGLSGTLCARTGTMLTTCWPPQSWGVAKLRGGKPTTCTCHTGCLRGALFI